MPVAAAIAGAAVVGAGASIISGNKAAKATKQAAGQSVAEQQREYDQTRSDNEPFMQTGYGALGKLASMYGVTPQDASGHPIGGSPTAGTGYANDGGYSASPGYQFQLDQGIKAATRSAAARGVLQSGGTEKALARYATGLAASDYDQYANRLSQLAGVGQSSTNAVGAAGANMANSNSNAYMNAGNASASAYANTGAAVSNGAQNLAALYMYQKDGGFSPTASSYGTVRDLPATIGGPGSTLPPMSIPGL